MTASPVRVRLVTNAAAYAVGMRAAHRAALVVGWLARRRARDQWLSRRMLTATPSPWAAPIRKDSR